MSFSFFRSQTPCAGDFHAMTVELHDEIEIDFSGHRGGSRYLISTDDSKIWKLLAFLRIT